MRRLLTAVARILARRRRRRSCPACGAPRTVSLGPTWWMLDDYGAWQQVDGAEAVDRLRKAGLL